ncbi:MAG: hypothetical protein KAH57_00100, partial [Thermoplasmata archaeon]|nr:hypothetical protein [Thermoplasmata archaeon]
MVEILDLDNAKHRMQMVLNRTGLHHHIDAEILSNWLDIDDGKNLGIMPILRLLTGLMTPEKFNDGSSLDLLVSSIMDLHNSINARIVDDVFKRDKLKIGVSEVKLPPNEWTVHYSNAMKMMHDDDVVGASDEFDEVFESLLEEHTTDHYLYRVYYNASLAHLLGGRPDLGMLCLDHAIELNPNYPLARKKREELEEDEFLEKLIELGIYKRLTRRIENNSPFGDLDRIMHLSEKELIMGLQKMGVEFSKEEFLEHSRKMNSMDELAEEVYYPQVNKEDSNTDLVWMTTHALWNIYCPEEPAIEYIMDILGDIEGLLDEDDEPNIDILDKGLTEFEKWIYSEKKGFIDCWKATSVYSSSDRHTLMEIFMILGEEHQSHERITSLSDHLFKKIGDPLWKVALLILNDGDLDVSYDKLRSDYPRSYLIPLYMSLHSMHGGYINKAHEFILEAIEVAEGNRKDGVEYEWNSGSIKSDLTHVYDILENLYKSEEPNGKMIDILERGMKNIDELSDEVDEESVEKKMKEIMNDIIKKNPAIRYMEFIGDLGIHFETGEDVASDIRDLNIHRMLKEDKKIGRNDPCPCG